MTSALIFTVFIVGALLAALSFYAEGFKFKVKDVKIAETQESLADRVTNLEIVVVKILANVDSILKLPEAKTTKKKSDTGETEKKEKEKDIETKGASEKEEAKGGIQPEPKK